MLAFALNRMSYCIMRVDKEMKKGQLPQIIMICNEMGPFLFLYCFVLALSLSLSLCLCPSLSVSVSVSVSLCLSLSLSLSLSPPFLRVLNWGESISPFCEL